MERIVMFYTRLPHTSSNWIIKIIKQRIKELNGSSERSFIKASLNSSSSQPELIKQHL